MWSSLRRPVSPVSPVRVRGLPIQNFRLNGVGPHRFFSYLHHRLAILGVLHTQQAYLAQCPRCIYRHLRLVVENISPNVWPDPKLTLVFLATPQPTKSG